MNAWVINFLSFSFFCALCSTSVLYFLAPQKWKLNIISLATFIFLLFAAPWSCLWLSVSTLIVAIGVRWQQSKMLILILIISLVFLVDQYFMRPVSPKKLYS